MCEQLSYVGNKEGLLKYIGDEVLEDLFQTEDKRRSEAEEADRLELQELEENGY